MTQPTQSPANDTGDTLVPGGKAVFERADRSRTFQTRRSKARDKKARPHVTSATWMKMTAALLSVITHRLRA